MRTSFAALLLLAPACAWAQQPPTPPAPAAAERTVTVSATGTVELEPEQAVVLIAVENTAATADAAAQQNAEQMERLLAALRRIGIAENDIRTTSYQLNPEYDFREPRDPQQPPRIIGYRAMNMVEVTVDDVAQVGAVIDAAVAAGANRINGVRFQLRDPEAARVRAITDAVRRARLEAEALARAFGQRLGPVLAVSTTGVTPIQPLLRTARVEMAATPIEPGTLAVSATVSVVYRLESP